MDKYSSPARLGIHRPHMSSPILVNCEAPFESGSTSALSGLHQDVYPARPHKKDGCMGHFEAFISSTQNKQLMYIYSKSEIIITDSSIPYRP